MTTARSLSDAMFSLAIWISGVAAMILGVIATSQGLWGLSGEWIVVWWCAAGAVCFIGGAALVFMAASIANNTFKAVNLLEGKE